MGIKKKSPVYKIPLNEKNKLDSLNQGFKHKSFKWSLVVFSDECRICLGTKKRKAWVYPGSKHKLIRPTHTKKLHIWGGICRKGIVGVTIF